MIVAIRIIVSFLCFGTFAQEKFTTENIIIKHEGFPKIELKSEVEFTVGDSIIVMEYKNGIYLKYLINIGGATKLTYFAHKKENTYQFESTYIRIEGRVILKLDKDITNGNINSEIYH